MSRKLFIIGLVLLLLSSFAYAELNIFERCKFNEGSGTQTACEITGSTYGFNGNPTWVAPYPRLQYNNTYYFNYSLEFDGTADSVNIIHTSQVSPTEGTIHIWVNTTTDNGDTVVFDIGTLTMLKKRTGQCTDANTYCFQYYAGSNYYIGDVDESLVEDGAWHAFTLTWNCTSNTQVAYFDGTPIETRNIACTNLRLADNTASYNVLGEEGAGAREWIGQIGGFHRYQKELTQGQIQNLIQCGDAESCSSNQIPSFVKSTPQDGVTNSTQQTISVNCTSGNVTLWYDGNTNPVNKVVNNKPPIYDYNTTNTTETTYYYKASCDGGDSNSSVQSWTYDITSPSITINPNNFFSTNNDSNISKVTPGLILNFTLTDNIDLFGYFINISYQDGSTYYNITNITLTGTTDTIVKAMDLSSFAYGNYSVFIEAADSHTDKVIPDYNYTIQGNKIIFWTPEGNEIVVQSQGNSQASLEKLEDRYTFSFDFGDHSNPAKNFFIKCTNEIRYIQDSLYQGHFVCFNQNAPSVKGGNWVDWVIEGHEDLIPTITQQPDEDGYHIYKIGYFVADDRVKFKSIGGLNVNNVTYNFSVIQLYPVGPYFELNGLQLWNYSSEYSLNQNISINISYINSILANNCQGGRIIGEYCRLNLSFHSDAPGILGIDVQHTLNYSYGIDACTNSYGIPSNGTTANITFFDTSGNQINVLNNINLPYGFTTSSKTENFSFSQTSNATLLCIYPNWGNLYGDLLVEYINASTHYEFNTLNTNFTNITKHFVNYLSGGTTQVTFTVTDDSDIPLENYLIKVQEFDVGTGSYITHETVKTDNAGQAVANIILSTEYYRFLVYDDSGNLVLTYPATQGIKLYSTSYTLVVGTGADVWFTSFDDALGVSYTFTFNNATATYVFSWDRADGSSVEGCLRVDEYNSSGGYTLTDTCTTSSSATITYTIAQNAGSRYVGQAYFHYNPDIVVDIIEKLYDYVFGFAQKNKEESGYMAMVFVGAMALIGVPFPMVSLLLTAFALFIVVITGLFKMSIMFITTLVVISLIHAYRGFKK